MTSAQKFSISFLGAVIIFSGFAFIAFSGLFNYIDTTFYNNRIIQQKEEQLDQAVSVINDYHQKNITRFNGILSNDSVKNIFRINQSREDIQTYVNFFGKLYEQIEALSIIRFVDKTGEKLFFSDKPSDILNETSFSRNYRSVIEIDEDPSPADLVLEESDPADVLYSNSLNSYIYRFPVYDTFNVYQGTAMFYVNIGGITTPLVREGIVNTNETVRSLSDDGILLNINPRYEESIVDFVQTRWESVVDESEENYFFITYDDSEGYRIFYDNSLSAKIAMIFPENLFNMPQFLNIILLVSVFLTVFLIIFLLLNLKQDPVLVLSDRIKRFQINLLREYMEEKENLDWKRWQAELEIRRDDLSKNIKKGIGRIKKSKEEEVDRMINKSWDEIIAVLGDKKTQEPKERIEMPQIEELLDRVVHNLKTINFDTTVSERKAPEISLPNKVSSGMEEETEKAQPSQQSQKIAEETGAAADLDEEEPEELEELEELEEFEEDGEDTSDETVSIEEELVQAAQEEETEAEELEEIGEEDELEELEEIGPEDDEEAVEEADVEEPEEEILELEMLDADEASALEEYNEEEPETVEEYNEEADEVLELEEIDTVREIEEAEELSFLEGDTDTAELEELDSEDIPENEFEETGELEEYDIDETYVAAEEIFDTEEDELEELAELSEVFSKEDVEAVEEIHQYYSSMETPEEISESEELLEEETEHEDELEELEQLDEAEPDEVEIIGSGDMEELDELAVVDDVSDDDDEAIIVDEPVKTAGSTLFTSYAFGDSHLVFKEVSTDITEKEEKVLPKIFSDEDFESISPRDVVEIIEKEEIRIAENEEGIYQISQLGDTELNEKNEEFRSLVDSIIRTPVEAIEETSKSGIEDIFSYDAIELFPTDASNKEELEQESEEESSEDNSKAPQQRLVFGERGLDYDKFMRGFAHGERGILKSFVAFTRIWDATTGAVLKPTDTGFEPRYTLGVEEEGFKNLLIRIESEVYQRFFKQRQIVFVKKSLKEIDGVEGLEDNLIATFLRKTLFIPVIFENKDTYLMLGIKDTIGSLMELFDHAKDLSHQVA
ncbi:MAG: hypothetical protein ACLFSE_02220 [Spirochaetia bacterium]